MEPNVHIKQLRMLWVSKELKIANSFLPHNLNINVTFKKKLKSQFIGNIDDTYFDLKIFVDLDF